MEIAKLKEDQKVKLKKKNFCLSLSQSVLIFVVFRSFAKFEEQILCKSFAGHQATLRVRHYKMLYLSRHLSFSHKLDHPEKLARDSSSSFCTQYECSIKNYMTLSPGANVIKLFADASYECS